MICAGEPTRWLAIVVLTSALMFPAGYLVGYVSGFRRGVRG